GDLREDLMSTGPVQLEHHDQVATVTLNRPDALNSLNTHTKEQLRSTIDDVAIDPEVRAVVLTGSGRAFCAGEDLREHAEGLQAGRGDLGRTVTEHYNPLILALTRMQKPVIAAVTGVAAGAGASLAFACDRRVLSQTASFSMAFTQIALAVDSGMSWHLPRLVGAARARELLMRPRKIEADEADHLGLATEIVPSDQLLPRVHEIAAELAAGPTLAYAAVREALLYSATHDLPESLANEATLMSRTGATADHRAAVEAFLAKETPRFEGR